MNRLSRAALFICYILIFLAGFIYYPKWKQNGTEATISWDVSGYYMYLPALFIYKDLKKCGFRDSVLQKYAPTPDFQQAFLHSGGNYIMKYSSGQALMLSPFFGAGHLVAKTSGSYEADGFSRPYQLAISIGMLLYCFLGLFVLRKVLLAFFPDHVVAITLAALVLGSNYFNYASIDSAMTHNTLFTVYALILFFVARFYKNPGITGAVMIGLLTGLATLTRPTEMISLLLPLLWNVGSINDLRTRLQFFLRKFHYPLVMGLCFLLVCSIQLFYWKWVSGQWLVYSYQNEGFDWLHPHIKNCLVSYRSGWLTYSPLMILSILGFIPLHKNLKSLFWPVAVFSLLFMYICFSWQTWWYGGSLGQRAMIQSYPVLSFPLAGMISFLIQKNRVVRLLTILFLSICICYTLWFTHQAHRGGLFRAGEMNRAYFWAIIGRSKVDEDVYTLLDNKDLYTGTVAGATEVYNQKFEQYTSPNITQVDAIEGHSLFLDEQNQASQEFFFSVPKGPETWIRASADFRATQKEWDTWKMTQFIVRFYQNSRKIQTNSIRVFRLLQDGDQKRLHVDARLPDSFDSVSVQFWNSGSNKKVLIDNLQVIVF